MTGLAGRSSGLGPTAQQVTEGESWAVEVDLNPIAADLLLDLARALHRQGRMWQFRRLAMFPPGHPSAGELLAAVVSDADVQTVLRVPLHPDAAERLSSELYNSLTEPDACRWGDGDCGNYVGTDLLYCDRHREMAEGISERIGRAR